MTEGEITAWGAAFAVAAAAAGKAAYDWWQGRGREKRKDASWAIKECQSLLNELRLEVKRRDEQLQRHDGHLQERERLLDVIYDDANDCHAQQSLMFSWMERAHDHMAYTTAALEGLGRPGPKAPDLPPKPSPRLSRAEAEFRVRSMRQDAELLRATDSQIINPPKKGGGQP